MAKRTLIYYFTLVSPWAYLGHRELHAIAARRDCAIDPRPVSLSVVFPQTGGLPLAQRHAARQAYRLVEMQRWREKRGIALTLRPKFFPCDISLCDRVALAIGMDGGDMGGFTLAAFEAIWRDDRNAADRETIAALLREAGLDPTFIERAESAAVRERYANHTTEAIAMGVFGSPDYVLDGEIFWGQDRLELLDEALASGRPAYAP